MKRILIAVVVSLVMMAGSFAAELYVEAQFDIAGKALSKSFLTVKGPGESVTKDTVDVASGASKMKGTEVLNSYRVGADKKNTLPAGLQSLLKYGVSPESFFIGDALNATKAKDGVITIQYAHRGTAYIMVSDKKGQFTIPGADCKLRKIANLEADGSQKVSTDFSPTGKVADIVWAKVWDASIADGKVITTITAADGKVTEVKTGKIVVDAAPSATPYVGVFKVTLKDNFLTMKADLKN